MCFFSCLIAMVRTSNTILSKSSECGHPCPVPSLWKAENFWVWCYLWVIIYGLYYAEVYPLYILLWIFILNGYWILKNAFPASIEIIIWFLSYIFLLWYISCLVFVDVELFLHTWSWCMILSMYCWIPFADMLLRIFAFIHPIFIKDALFIILFLCVVSMSDFGVRVLPAL